MAPAGRPPAADDRSLAAPGPLVELGRIVNTHGIRGELRVLPHNPASSTLIERTTLVLGRRDGGVETRRITGARPHKQFVLLQLDGVATAEAAEALVGCTVSMPRAELPPAGPAAAYHVDLIGCRVESTAGQALGTVREVIVTGSNDVCVVRGAGREYLIPLVADVVAALDTTARTITVHPLPGLLDE